MAAAWAVIAAQSLEKFGVKMEWPALVAMCERALEMYVSGYEKEQIELEVLPYGGLAVEAYENAEEHGYDLKGMQHWR